jgi:PAS domain S-box-containing protein
MTVPLDTGHPKQHDLELLSNQDRLEAFFSQSPDGFFFMMLDGPTQWDDTVDKEALLDHVFNHQHVTKVNGAMLAQYAASEDNFLGLTPKDFFAHDLETGRQLWREMFDKGRLHVETFEHRLDGTSMWIEGDYSCLYDLDGKLIGHFGIQREINSRKQAEEELKQITTALSHAVEGISRLDTQGRYQMVNQAYANAVGYQPEDMIGMEWPRTVHPDDLDRLMAAYEEMLRTGKVKVEARGVRKDGSLFYKQLTMVATYDPQQKLTGHYCFMKDISESVRNEAERNAAEEELRQSEERLQSLIDNAGSVIYIKNPEGQYISINRQYETLFHLEKETVQGKTDHDIFPKAIADNFRKNDLEVLAAGAPIESEEVAPQSDGLHTYLSVKFPLFDGEGKIYAVCGISTDISDRKTAEVHLRQQEAFLKSIYDGTEQAIFVVDISEDGELRYANFNPVSEKYAGVTNADIQGKTPEEAFGEVLGPMIRQNYERCLQTGTSISYEEQLNFDPHIIWTLTTLVPLRDDQGQIYRMIGTATDISDRKTAELELQQQKQDLARSNDELQQFAYVASHDLQEPLRMISSYLELLERRYKGQLDPKADQFIAYAVDGAARMQILINDLLKYSRVGSRGQLLEQVDCEVILQNVLRNLQVAIAENKAVITHDALPQVNADITQLTQLFQNLIGNAIKFHGEDPPNIYIGIEHRNDKWLFSVCDNGIGIESQYVDRIFVIFQRLHNRTDYPGTGMGLAICKKIVERHSGNLWVESTPKQGSTFYFTLPVLGASAP